MLIMILTIIIVNILVPQVNGHHYNVFVRLAFKSKKYKIHVTSVTVDLLRQA